jgi:hypothetical protein
VFLCPRQDVSPMPRRRSFPIDVNLSIRKLPSRFHRILGSAYASSPIRLLKPLQANIDSVPDAPDRFNCSPEAGRPLRAHLQGPSLTYPARSGRRRPGGTRRRGAFQYLARFHAPCRPLSRIIQLPDVG